jgi:hypothetical protein
MGFKKSLYSINYLKIRRASVKTTNIEINQRLYSTVKCPRPICFRSPECLTVNCRTDLDTTHPPSLQSWHFVNLCVAWRTVALLWPVVLLTSFVTHIPWYRDGIHESTILLRFLVIILILLRLEVSNFVFAFYSKFYSWQTWVFFIDWLFSMDFLNHRGDMVFWFSVSFSSSKESIPRNRFHHPICPGLPVRQPYSYSVTSPHRLL